MANTCASVLTLGEYYNSCPSKSLLKDLHINGACLARLTSFDSGSGLRTPTFIYLKTLLENTGYLDYIKHPQKMIDARSRLPSSEKNNVTKAELPKVFQGLWLTNKNNPKAISPHLDNFLIQAKKLNGYKTVIWTNIDANKLIEMNPKLKIANITVKNIANIQTEYTQLLDFISSPKNYVTHPSSFNGVLIDVAKYIIMENQGGILADLNFKFDNKFEQINLELYDFIASAKGLVMPVNNWLNVENGFFVAKPHHLIFKETMDIIDEMLNNKDCALQELREIIDGDAPTDIFSMMPLTLGYMKYNNIEDNVDALIGGCSYKNYSPNIDQLKEHEAIVSKLDSSDPQDILDYIISYSRIMGQVPRNSSCIEEGIIGTDNGSMTWVHADIA